VRAPVRGISLLLLACNYFSWEISHASIRDLFPNLGKLFLVSAKLQNPSFYGVRAPLNLFAAWGAQSPGKPYQSNLNSNRRRFYECHLTDVVHHFCSKLLQHPDPESLNQRTSYFSRPFAIPLSKGGLFLLSSYFLNPIFLLLVIFLFFFFLFFLFLLFFLLFSFLFSYFFHGLFLNFILFFIFSFIIFPLFYFLYFFLLFLSYISFFLNFSLYIFSFIFFPLFFSFIFSFIFFLYFFIFFLLIFW